MLEIKKLMKLIDDDSIQRDNIMSGLVSLKYQANGFKTERWLKKNSNLNLEQYVEECGKIGVEALKNNTPRDTGLTANSWTYDITIDRSIGKVTIQWSNTNVVNEWFNVALMLQYGHGTASGVWVEGIDYINPALKPIFDDISNRLWKEVTDNE